MTRLPLAVLLICPVLAAQTIVSVPDANSSAGAACNVIPFGSTFSAGYSYIGRVPASFLSAGDTRRWNHGRIGGAVPMTNGKCCGTRRERQV